MCSWFLLISDTVNTSETLALQVFIKYGLYCEDKTNTNSIDACYYEVIINCRIIATHRMVSY